MGALAVVAGLLLAGCSSTPAVPAPPSGSALRELIAESSGLGPDGYARYGVTLIRFISAEQWSQVMTTCVAQRGITGVDFTNASDPYWSANPGQGKEALQDALRACSLEYPDSSSRPALLSDAQWTFEFHYLHGWFRSCLLATGTTYSPPASLSDYLAAAHAFSVADPFISVSPARSGLPPSALSRMCPPIAPELRTP